MKVHHIIFMALCLAFVIYLLYREYAHNYFHHHMKIGDSYSFYIDEQRTPGIIRHIEPETGQIVILDMEMKGYIRSRNDVYPPFHPLLYFV